MSSPRGRWLLAIAPLMAASCWDGALDPILGAPDGGDLDTDADSDTDTDTDTDTDVDTEPVPCSVSVPIYDDDTWYVACTYAAPGFCADDTATCSGCAWAEEVVSGCAAGQSCCIDESEFQLCVTVLGGGWSCGYEEAEICPSDESWGVKSDDPTELPVCPGGAFCCSNDYEDGA
jgi:hypothetical protein